MNRARPGSFCPTFHLAGVRVPNNCLSIRASRKDSRLTARVGERRKFGSRHDNCAQRPRISGRRRHALRRQGLLHWAKPSPDFPGIGSLVEPTKKEPDKLGVVIFASETNRRD